MTTIIEEPITELRAGMNRLRGQLFQLVEAVGLPQKQEDALKGCVRSTTYQNQANLEALLRGKES